MFCVKCTVSKVLFLLRVSCLCSFVFVLYTQSSVESTFIELNYESSDHYIFCAVDS